MMNLPQPVHCMQGAYFDSMIERTKEYRKKRRFAKNSLRRAAKQYEAALDADKKKGSFIEQGSRRIARAAKSISIDGFAVPILHPISFVFTGTAPERFKTKGRESYKIQDARDALAEEAGWYAERGVSLKRILLNEKSDFRALVELSKQLDRVHSTPFEKGMRWLFKDWKHAVATASAAALAIGAVTFMPPVAGFFGSLMGSWLTTYVYGFGAAYLSARLFLGSAAGYLLSRFMVKRWREARQPVSAIEAARKISRYRKYAMGGTITASLAGTAGGFALFENFSGRLAKMFGLEPNETLADTKVRYAELLNEARDAARGEPFFMPMTDADNAALGSIVERMKSSPLIPEGGPAKSALLQKYIEIFSGIQDGSIKIENSSNARELLQKALALSEEVRLAELVRIKGDEFLAARKGGRGAGISNESFDLIISAFGDSKDDRSRVWEMVHKCEAAIQELARSVESATARYEYERKGGAGLLELATLYGIQKVAGPATHEPITAILDGVEGSRVSQTEVVLQLPGIPEKSTLLPFDPENPFETLGKTITGVSEQITYAEELQTMYPLLISEVTNNTDVGFANPEFNPKFVNYSDDLNNAVKRLREIRSDLESFHPIVKNAGNIANSIGDADAVYTLIKQWASRLQVGEVDHLVDRFIVPVQAQLNSIPDGYVMHEGYVRHIDQVLRFKEGAGTDIYPLLGAQLLELNEILKSVDIHDMRINEGWELSRSHLSSYQRSGWGIDFTFAESLSGKSPEQHPQKLAAALLADYMLPNLDLTLEVPYDPSHGSLGKSRAVSRVAAEILPELESLITKMLGASHNGGNDEVALKLSQLVENDPKFNGDIRSFAEELVTGGKVIAVSKNWISGLHFSARFDGIPLKKLQEMVTS